MRLATLALLACSLPASGCIRAFGPMHDAAISVGDASGESTDARPPDGASEGPAPRDGTTDAPPLDTTRDGPAADTTHDAIATADTTRDSAAPIDTTRDSAAPADGSVDGAVVTAPCVNGNAVFAYSATMAICPAGSAALTQCTAATACNAAGGWQLCTAAQYRARGGATTARTEAAWIAGCIRDGATPYAPTNAVCSSCSTTAAATTSVAWRCSNGNQSDTSNHAYVGMVSFVDCRRIGVNTADAGAYWRIANSFDAYGHAVCCH